MTALQGTSNISRFDGKNPVNSPVEIGSLCMFMPLFTNVYKSQVVQDFFHPQYLLPLVYMKTCTKIPLPLPCHVFLTFQAVRKWVILIILFFSQSGTNRWEVHRLQPESHQLVDRL